MNQKDIWQYLIKDLGKVKELLDMSEKLLEKLNAKNGRYFQSFVVIMDSLTTNIFITLARFFETDSKSWSLYSFGLKKDIIKKAAKEAESLIQERHIKIAHLDRGESHVHHFRYLDPVGIKKTREIVKSIASILEIIRLRICPKEVYVLGWLDIENSLDNMLEDLLSYDHMKAWEEKYFPKTN